MAFTEDFWEDDGFDRLILRLREGKDALKNLNSFLNERASIEESYSKALLKLQSKHTLDEEMPSQRAAYDALRNEALETGMAAKQLSDCLKDLGAKVMAYKDTQKSMRKANYADRDKFDKALLKNEANVQKFKAKYWAQGDKTDQLHIAYNTTAANKSIPRREIAASRSKWEASEKELQKAAQKYQATIPSLNNAQREWEDNMLRLFTDISAVQMQNTATVKQFLKQAETDIANRVAALQATLEPLGAAVDAIDDEADVAAWVAQHRTGSNRPKLYEFERYASQFGTQDDVGGSDAQSEDTNGPSNPPSRKQSLGGDVVDAGAGGLPPPDMLPTDPAFATQQNDPAMGGGDPNAGGGGGVEFDAAALASAIGDLDLKELPPPPPAASADPAEFWISALYDYAPQYQGEIALAANDRILVLETSETGWWRGRVESTGAEGLFPANYTDAGQPSV